MVARVIHVVRLLIVLASRHRSLVLENLALRQQLAMYQRARPKPVGLELPILALIPGLDNVASRPPPGLR